MIQVDQFFDILVLMFLNFWLKKKKFISNIFSYRNNLFNKTNELRYSEEGFYSILLSDGDSIIADLQKGNITLFFLFHIIQIFFCIH